MDQGDFEKMSRHGTPLQVRVADALRNSGLTATASSQVMTTVTVLVVLTVVIVSWNVYSAKDKGFIVDPDLLISYNEEL